MCNLYHFCVMLIQNGCSVNRDQNISHFQSRGFCWSIWLNSSDHHWFGSMNAKPKLTRFTFDKYSLINFCKIKAKTLNIFSFRYTALNSIESRSYALYLLNYTPFCAPDTVFIACPSRAQTISISLKISSNFLRNESEEEFDDISSVIVISGNLL